MSTYVQSAYDDGYKDGHKAALADMVHNLRRNWCSCLAENGQCRACQIAAYYDDSALSANAEINATGEGYPDLSGIERCRENG